MSDSTRKSIFLLVFMVAGFWAAAQQPLSSPYSRYGIGEIYRGSNLQTMSLGGAAIGMRSPLYINYLNPASYTAFDTLSFVFDGAITSSFVTLRNQDISQRASFTTVKNLLFGMPMNRWWKISFGLMPFSQVGYTVKDEMVIDSVGRVRMLYEGEGGFNQLYLGHGFRINKNLSVGMNVSYLFGTISRLRSLSFPDSVYVRYFRVKDQISANDFLFNYGVQYHTTLPRNLKLTIGATYANSLQVKAGQSLLSETFIQGSTGIVYVKDTIENRPTTEGKIQLPSAYGAGVSLEKENRWLLAADYRLQNWSDFRMFGEKDSLQNSMEAALGFQFIPDYNSLSGYAQKITYRAGIRYARTYLQLRTHHLEEMAFTFGFGLPLAKTRSRLNLGFEIGQRGTTADQLIQENFFMVTLGVSVLENWFYRRKFE